MKKAKRILALIGAILLLSLYIITLIFSLMKGELAKDLFFISFACTFIIPVFLYGYMLVYRILTKKNKDK